MSETTLFFILAIGMIFVALFANKLQKNFISNDASNASFNF